MTLTSSQKMLTLCITFYCDQKNAIFLKYMQGPQTTFDERAEVGLPSSMGAVTKRALFKSVRSATKGDDPVLQWQPPISGARALKLTLEDRQQLPGSFDRLALVTLRAKEKHCDRPAWDNVRVAVESEEGMKIHFGRCLHFMRDSCGAHFIALRWYTETTKDFTLHDDTGSIRLQIAPAENESSYSVMPIGSVVNGAYIIDCAGYSWVIQSPREEQHYLKINKK